ncbi:hypothetical protein CEXT_240921 [Caerostris extrusa]|uniref:Uncharacterized protein n=1 Tax=Caerostris extrusa TaxID=172846 RepID=A0AAV4XGH4_CAEEX|nr:hypothetical protein CEXT_240921 [Caerostris extrusa]
MPSWFRDGCPTSYCTSDKESSPQRGLPERVSSLMLCTSCHARKSSKNTWNRKSDKSSFPTEILDGNQLLSAEVKRKVYIIIILLKNNVPKQQRILCRDHLALDQRALYATNSTNTTSPTSEFHQGKWITFQRYYPLLNNETSQDG